MVSEDFEVFLGTMEVVRAPGQVGLTDAKRQELPCSGVMTFNIQIAGRTTSVTAWVSPVLRSRIIVESRTLEDLGFSAVEETPGWTGSDGPIKESLCTCMYAFIASKWPQYQSVKILQSVENLPFDPSLLEEIAVKNSRFERGK